MALSGLLAPFFAHRLGAPELGRLLVLPILAYSGFALGLGGALELVRRPSERRGRSWLRFILLFAVLTTVAGAVGPMIAKHLPKSARELVPLFLILGGLPLISQITRGRKLPRRDSKDKEAPVSPWSTEILAPRIVGVSLALFLLTLVGALPGFIAAELQGTRFEPLPGGFPITAHVVFFVLTLALLLALHATVAERLWPRWPRLMLLLLVGVPIALSLAVPGFPNLFDLFASYLGWLEGHLAPSLRVV